MADVTTPVETKEVSKTELFKEHIQKIIYQQTGKKVSKSVAWGLFKAIYHGSIEFAINQEDKKVPLSGVCTIEILETKPRGSKAGLDENGNPIEGAEVWPCVPRARFYPSSVVDKYVEYKYGLGNHEDVVEIHYGIYKTDDAPAESEAEETAEAPAESTEEVDLDEALADLDEI